MKLTLQFQAVKISRIKSSFAADIVFECSELDKRANWTYQCLRANVTRVERTRDDRISRALNNRPAVGEYRHLVRCDVKPH